MERVNKRLWRVCIGNCSQKQFGKKIMIYIQKSSHLFWNRENFSIPEMKKATCLSAAVLQNSAVLLATNNISNSQKWHALGILFSVLCRHTAWLAFVFPEFICISHPGHAVAHLTNDGSTVISRWSDLQRKYSENISYTIVADERNGSGPNSSCLPLHLISRSYGENLPAVNI